MYIVEVSPLKSLGNIKSLTYFSKHEYKTGDLIKVGVNKKEILSLVINSKPVLSIKADIKSKDFAPKKISKQEPIKLFSKEFVNAIMDTSENLLVPAGLLLNQMAISEALKHADKLYKKIQISKALQKKETKSTQSKFQITAYNCSKKDKLEHYKALIREKLARGQSVLLVTTNQREVKNLYNSLKPGIRKMIEMFDSSEKQTKLFSNIAHLSGHKGAICIVGTGKLLTLPIDNIGLVIIDKCNSSAYKYIEYPRGDIKMVATNLCKHISCEIVFADIFLNLDMYAMALKDELHIVDGIPRKIRTSKNIELTDISKEILYTKENKLPYPFVGREVLEIIREFQEKEKKIFTYVPKMGLASQIICKDCAFVVKCSKCGANMKLNKVNANENNFLCSRCGHAKDANTKCANCDSWNLIELGITDEVVSDFIKKHLKIPVKLFDSNHVKTEKQALEFISNIKPGDIVVGTNKILSYVDENAFDLVVAVNLDGLMSVPDFKIEEKIFNLQMRLLEIASEKMIVQVKDTGIRAIELFVKKKINEFIREELKLRHKLMWPPYATLIKITAYGTKKEVIEQMQTLVNELRGYKIRVFRAFTKPKKGSFALSALVKIEKDKWPDKDLINILRFLPSSMDIQVNPDETI